MELRACALAWAETKIGVKESPPGSNRGPQIDGWNKLALGETGVPWCMSFVHAAYAHCGKTLGGWGSVERFSEWASAHGELVSRPFRGDVVCYDWNADGWADHVGIVERVLALAWRGQVFAGVIRAVEGNTSLGNDSNGGQVMRRTRRLGACKFARIV